MSAEQTVPNILSLAPICQYLAVNNIASNQAFKGGDIDQRVARLIYMERMAVQNRYNLNPSDPTLRSTANYLFSILRSIPTAQQIKNNLAGSKPIISGPFNQSVNTGNDATFTTSVISSTNVSYQWYRNNVLIPGATGSGYILSNAQLTDSGSTFFVIATNAAGSTVSGSATLTVTNSIIGYLYYTATDPGPTLISNSDPFAYQSNYPITHNSPISIPISVAAANNQFLVAKVPSTESAKSTWFNTNLNNGNIPPPADFVFATPVSFGGNTYYYTKTTVSLDPTAPLILS